MIKFTAIVIEDKKNNNVYFLYNVKLVRFIYIKDNKIYYIKFIHSKN